MEQILHTLINAGLEAPVRILHLTDAHMTFTDETDPPEQMELEQQRWHTFHREGHCPPHDPAWYFEEGIRMAEQLGAVLVCGGDFMDIQTSGNNRAFHRIADGHDMMFTPGGHEQQKRCVRTMEEPGGYWKKARAALSRMLPEFPLEFDSRIVGGLNIITADNSLDYYSEAALTAFKRELDRGLPMVVFGHDPINDPLLNAWEASGYDDPLTERDYAISHEMLDLIQTSPLVKAFIGGHAHREEEGILRSGNPFYTTPGLFAGICRLIEVR